MMSCRYLELTIREFPAARDVFLTSLTILRPHVKSAEIQACDFPVKSSFPLDTVLWLHVGQTGFARRA